MAWPSIHYSHRPHDIVQRRCSFIPQCSNTTTAHRARRYLVHRVQGPCHPWPMGPAARLGQCPPGASAGGPHRRWAAATGQGVFPAARPSLSTAAGATYSAVAGLLVVGSRLGGRPRRRPTTSYGSPSWVPWSLLHSASTTPSTRLYREAPPRPPGTPCTSRSACMYHVFFAPTHGFPPRLRPRTLHARLALCSSPLRPPVMEGQAGQARAASH